MPNSVAARREGRIPPPIVFEHLPFLMKLPSVELDDKSSDEQVDASHTPDRDLHERKVAESPQTKPSDRFNYGFGAWLNLGQEKSLPSREMSDVAEPLVSGEHSCSDSRLGCGENPLHALAENHVSQTLAR
ncbi:MAG: hypothetical protein ACOH19_14580 [Rhodoglobus sp.]